MAKPTSPGEDLIRALADFDLSIGELALDLREMVLEEAPEAIERLVRVYALVFWYSLSGRMKDAFVQVVVYRNGVNLMFNRGAELNDPEGVLVGEGKIIRHIKVRRPEDLKSRHLRKFIRAALRHAMARAKERELAERSKNPAARIPRKRSSRR